MPTWPTITDGVTRLSNALFGLIKTYIDDSLTGQGLPSGGATGDLLQKNSATNYDAGWTDAPTVDSVTLDTAAAEATGIAKIFWDATEGTVAFGMAGGVVTQQLGRNAFVRAKNVTASQINRGQVVYLTGAQGDRPTIELADATDESTSADTIGIAAENIAVSAEGEICISGILANVNTYGLTAGVMTYLSETAGAWTQTRPTQPAHGVRLGIPLKISASPSGNSGVFFVQVNNGYEFEELHDVLITAAAAGDILKRNAGNTLWVNTAPAALTKTDDTNVTLTLGGNASTALVNAASITAGWTGTLAANRLNSNVVQSVVNDTNVTGSIATQALTLGWTGQLAIARGGTGASTAQAAINALAGAVTSGQYLRGNGTNVVMSAIQVADVPTLNQNTTGTASNVTGTVAIVNGGSGTTTAQGAMNAFAGAVTSGSYLRGNGTNVVMSTIQAGDVPTLNQNTTGSAATLTTARTINGTSFNGSANITTASWGTPRTITIGSTGKNVDGSANISWTLSEIGAMAGAGYSANQNLNTSSGVTFSDVYNNGWFRNYGATGLYNQTYGRGIIESQAAGATYGNMTTYGSGNSGWDGWSIGTGTYQINFIGRPAVADWGVLTPLRGWAIYQNHSAHAGVSIGGSSPLSGYALRVEGSLYVNSSVVIAGSTAWHAGNMDAPNKSGTSYYQMNTWIQGNGSYGLYYPTTGLTSYSSAPHFYPGGTYYGSFAMQGARNGYAGLSIYDSGHTYYLMGDNGGYGAYVTATYTHWVWYYDRANNRTGFASSATRSGYSHTFNGAAWFEQPVYVNSSITVTGTKSFDITHPVAPTKRLRYAAIEGPRVDVLHRGVATVSGHAALDLDAEAQLLPGTSAALMRDLQCQLTNLSETFCQLRGRLDGTTLHIYTDSPEPVTVAWLVLGERQDDEIKATTGTDADGRLISEYDADPTIGQRTDPHAAAPQQE